jgi:hypothetical protein
MSKAILDQLARMSPAAIRQLLSARKHAAKRSKLQKQADGVRLQLARIETRIARIDSRIKGGRTEARKLRRARRKAHKSPRARRGATNGTSLKETLSGLLRRAGEPLRVKDLTRLALKAGYKTKSDPVTFMRAVSMTLGSSKEFSRQARGVYGLHR